MHMKSALVGLLGGISLTVLAAGILSNSIGKFPKGLSVSRMQYENGFLNNETGNGFQRLEDVLTWRLKRLSEKLSIGSENVLEVNVQPSRSCWYQSGFFSTARNLARFDEKMNATSGGFDKLEDQIYRIKKQNEVFGKIILRMLDDHPEMMTYLSQEDYFVGDDKNNPDKKKLSPIVYGSNLVP